MWDSDLVVVAEAAAVAIVLVTVLEEHYDCHDCVVALLRRAPAAAVAKVLAFCEWIEPPSGRIVAAVSGLLLISYA